MLMGMEDVGNDATKFLAFRANEPLPQLVTRVQTFVPPRSIAKSTMQQVITILAATAVSLHSEFCTPHPTLVWCVSHTAVNLRGSLTSTGTRVRLVTFLR
jgi:hypothetical protein